MGLSTLTDSIMSAALSLTTDRSMFPRDLIPELRDDSQQDSTRPIRLRDHMLLLKTLDGCGPINAVLTLDPTLSVYYLRSESRY
jgi:hypothetical protein